MAVPPRFDEHRTARPIHDMKSAGGLILLIAVFSGCAPHRMSLPADLEQVPEWEVRARHRLRLGERLYFGEYEVHDISRGVIRSRGGIVDMLKGKNELQQKYSFRLRNRVDEADLWEVRCDNRDVEQAIRLGSFEITLDEATSLDCTFQRLPDDELVWSLRLGSRREKQHTGLLQREGAAYTLEGEPRREVGTSRVLGYVIRSDTRIVGAVERYERGRIRLVQDLEGAERDLLAAASVALLLRSNLIEGPG